MSYVKRIIQFLKGNRNIRATIKDDNVLNFGLSLAMEFGSNWQKPTQCRLKQKYPCFTNMELNIIDKICRDAMSFSHNTIYALVESKGKDFDKENTIKTIRDKYPWIDSKNINHLMSQGLYYSYKDGLQW
tara:strand:- start:809 stop:1198 length:390 start_codon:yes stop_codon:yes gene_type:complete